MLLDNYSNSKPVPRGQVFLSDYYSLYRLFNYHQSFVIKKDFMVAIPAAPAHHRASRSVPAHPARLIAAVQRAEGSAVEGRRTFHHRKRVRPAIGPGLLSVYHVSVILSILFILSNRKKRLTKFFQNGSRSLLVIITAVFKMPAVVFRVYQINQK